MKRRLFLTGPIGCGKSTAIEKALGQKLCRCGGFLTRRVRNEQGHPVSFYLAAPDGSAEETFLELSSGKLEIHMQVFEKLGVTVLRGDCLILDEIGGVELLCPSFMAALEDLLKSDIPVIGVIKGEGASAALIEALGFSEEYQTAANRLRSWLREDRDTLLYECAQFDENALHLAKAWVEEYVHE